MSSRHTTKNINSNTPSEDEYFDKIIQTENTTDYTQNQTSVESNTNPTKITQQNPLQSADSSYSEKITEQAQNAS